VADASQSCNGQECCGSLVDSKSGSVMVTSVPTGLYAPKKKKKKKNTTCGRTPGGDDEKSKFATPVKIQHGSVMCRFSGGDTGGTKSKQAGPTGFLRFFPPSLK